MQLSDEVLRMQRLVPIELELKVQRLKFLQELVSRPKHHEFVLTAVLSPYAFDSEEERRNPWHQQVVDDMHTMYLLEDAQAVLDDSNFCIKTICCFS